MGELTADISGESTNWRLRRTIHFWACVTSGGDVYHDAKGTILPDVERAKDRAFEMVRKMTVHARDRMLSAPSATSTAHR